MSSSHRFFIACIAVAAIAWVLWPDKSPEQKAKEQDEAIGTEASVTAGLMFSAYKNCMKLGVQSIPLCAQHKGPLPVEQIYAQLAATAMSQWEGYSTMCKKTHSAKYCNDLVNRALSIQSANDTP